MADGTIDNPYHLLPSVAKYLGLTDEQVWKLEDEQTEWTEDDDMTVVGRPGTKMKDWAKEYFSNN